MNDLVIIEKSYSYLTSILKKKLTEYRYEHTLGVAKVVLGLAAKNQIEEKEAVVAALLHDYARESEPELLLAEALEQKLKVSLLERRNPMLLHGRVAALKIEQDFNLKNKRILEAVAYHTTGHPEMDKMAMLIYLADMIEPTRMYPGVEELRALSFRDLELAVLQGMEQTILYNLGKGLLLHPFTLLARNNLIIHLEERAFNEFKRKS